MRWSIFLCAGLLPTVLGASEFSIETLRGITALHYLAYRTSGQLSIDGRLDEPSWQRAAWTEVFVDIEGGVRPAPRFKTRAKMLWDDEYFYVAADMEDPHVWATLEKRDTTVYNDNDFEVFIDPDGDTHEYYEVEVNALATPWDMFLVRPYRNDGPAITAWDIDQLQCAVTVWGTLNDPTDEDEGWSVELAFPWKVLKQASSKDWPAPPRNGDTWRVNFSRVQWQVDIGEEGYSKVPDEGGDHWVWSPQGLANMHYPEMWGFVQFISEVVGKGDATFVMPPEEEAKKVLREIYYRQNRFRDEYGYYTTSLDSLGLKYENLPSFLSPQVQVTDHSFEAWMEEVIDLHQDGEINRWYIRQDSRTWKGSKL